MSRPLSGSGSGRARATAGTTPRPTARTSSRATALGLLAGLLVTASLGLALGVGPAQAKEGNPVTPGDFTGYGFDQCQAPAQKTMNRWRRHSPFWAVGIYMAGDERACRDQTNLDADWVRTQLARGWRLLPITLGPQASCQPRFPRYPGDHTINPKPGRNGHYWAAQKQGTAEATSTVSAAQALGIVPGSTMFYDLEGFSYGNTRCRESALAFLSAWTTRIHALGYVSGVYSSAGSGIKMLDQARVKRPGQFDLPDQIWVARWDGRANTTVDPAYLRADGWMPHARVKQYQGGHDETWGRAKVNIDRDYLDLGRGSVAPKETHCNGTVVTHPTYPRLRPATATYTPARGMVRTLQCLLDEQGVYQGKINGRYDDATLTAVGTWQAAHALPARSTWSRSAWMTLLTAGDRPLVKYGSAGLEVRRLQRALNAATWKARLKVTGIFDAATQTELRRYQDSVDLTIDGIAAGKTWTALATGQR